MSELQKCINRGVKFLDKQYPKWYDEIDLSSLRMDNICHCIVGQLYDNYWDGLEALGIESPFNLRFYYGLSTKSPAISFIQLKEAWTEKILSKRE